MRRLERLIYHRLTSLLWTFTGTQAILILLLSGATRHQNKQKETKIMRKAEVQGKQLFYYL